MQLIISCTRLWYMRETPTSVLQCDFELPCTISDLLQALEIHTQEVSTNCRVQLSTLPRSQDFPRALSVWCVLPFYP
jgi:hypothetical protein